MNFSRNFLLNKRFSGNLSSRENRVSLIVYPSVIKNKKGFIRILTKEKGELMLKFYTFSGHLVGERTYYIETSGVYKDIPFDFSFLTPGPYILKWTLGSQKGMFKFFVLK